MQTHEPTDQPAISGREYHVSPDGDDDNEGTPGAPLKTISAAALLAGPGDVVTVHVGTYRESINPPRGGESNTRRIVYQAAPGEVVEIKGSEVIKGWTRDGMEQGASDGWRVEIPNALFGDFNPYNDELKGDWFLSLGRRHLSGAVYVNGEELTQTWASWWVMNPAEAPGWAAEVTPDVTRIWANFGDINPNVATVEINVRRTIFYPRKTGINYVTVRGFIMRHAATPWESPSAEQIALLGTNWSRGWIIEDNIISHSRCVGITLGKYGDQFDHQSGDTAEGFMPTVRRALADGWTKGNVGHHIVRNNEVSHCEQAGITGGFASAFSEVTGNVVHNIHRKKLYEGAEQAGIKFHGAIDTLISNNHVYACPYGMWLDWMSQGTRISGNLLHDNERFDLFMEVNHGPHLVDNNILLSKGGLLNQSEGGAYVHNLIAGYIWCIPEPARETPYHSAHSTEMTGLAPTAGGDDRFLNNIIVDVERLRLHSGAAMPVLIEGNVALASMPRLVEEAGAYSLELTIEPGHAPCRQVTTKRLGLTVKPGLPFENPHGLPLVVDTDYYGRPRDRLCPSAGPFEITKSAAWKVWPHNLTLE